MSTPSPIRSRIRLIPWKKGNFSLRMETFLLNSFLYVKVSELVLPGSLCLTWPWKKRVQAGCRCCSSSSSKRRKIISINSLLNIHGKRWQLKLASLNLHTFVSFYRAIAIAAFDTLWNGWLFFLILLLFLYLFAFIWFMCTVEIFEYTRLPLIICCDFSKGIIVHGMSLYCDIIYCLFSSVFCRLWMRKI